MRPSHLIEEREIVLFGRDAERAVLRRVLVADAPLILFIHGVGGVGKSALLDDFAVDAQAAGAVCVRLDGGSIEPTTNGFLQALSTATGGEFDGPEAAVERLVILGPRVILAVDRYELLGPIDPWIRQAFVPRLRDTVRVVLSGRERPMRAWPLEMGRLFQGIPLANLAREDALRLLRHDGVRDEDLERINRLARGHPLSLRLAASALGDATEIDPDETTMTAIVAELTTLYLGRLDPLTREALDAAAVVRRPTMSLLAAMLPDAAPQDVFDRLLRLPYVELSNDGLALHDTIREGVAAALRASDPDRSRQYRVAAWRRLRDEIARSTRQDMRRYTADLIYLLENPTIREAYFPTAEQHFAIDQARADDLPAILELSRRQNPGESLALVEQWWESAPWAFRVVRDDLGPVVGFSVMADLERVPRRILDVDPVVQRWVDHLRRAPIPEGQRSLAYRFERADPEGSSAEAIHAACFLDLLRATMELRPELRRRYQVSAKIFDADDVETTLGLQRIAGDPIPIPDGRPRHAYWLDFGPGSVDGWLTKLVSTELAVDEDSMLDVVQHQLVLGDHRVDLTPLEFEVFKYLHERPGAVVERSVLMRDVWGYDDPGGSNVIEAVVASLRRKLGDRSPVIETVRGVGYRYVAMG